MTKNHSIVKALSQAIKQSAIIPADVGKCSSHLFFNSDFSGDHTLPSNFFDGSGDFLSINQEQQVVLRELEWISSDRFHNSLFIEPYRQFTQIDNIFIRVKFKGIAKLSVYLCDDQDHKKLLLTQTVQHDHMQTLKASLGCMEKFAPNCRIYWHLKSLSGQVLLDNVSYGTDSNPSSQGRLMILLRTYGRTQDIIQLLSRFNQDLGGRFSHLKNSLFFVVLDSSEQNLEEYQQPSWHHLQRFIFHAKNLGGGGNMSHLIYLLQQSLSRIKFAPDEILILDDDLVLSTEFLIRYYYFAAFRSQEVISSLPIFMKSKPKTIWEDGGYWGRLGMHEENLAFQRHSLFPTLIKHGQEVRSSKELGAFCHLNCCEYSTFIFFGLSYHSLQKLKYPAALFLRGDDIQFSLQAQELGIALFTNPNLAAWHEPGHSYAQEYMAILHGVLVNLVYGVENCRPYIDFFEQRLKHHANVYDDLGLSVYLKILTDLNNLQVEVLNENFEIHYQRMIQELNQLSQHYKAVSPTIIRRIQEQEVKQRETSSHQKLDQKQGITILPFLHFKSYPPLTFKEVLLYDHHRNQYYYIDTDDLHQRQKVFDLSARYHQQLAQFIENFSSLSQQWSKRFKNTCEASFWEHIAHLNQDHNFIIDNPQLDVANTSNNQAEPSAHKAQTKTKKNKTIPTSASHPVGSLANARKVTTAHKKTLELKPRHTGEPSIEELASLPDDFDPQHYLDLHPDLQKAGVDGIKHYLRHGKKEGRKWK